jgi:hypothetical protein
VNPQNFCLHGKGDWSTMRSRKRGGEGAMVPVWSMGLVPVVDVVGHAGQGEAAE